MTHQIHSVNQLRSTVDDPYSVMTSNTLTSDIIGNNSFYGQMLPGEQAFEEETSSKLLSGL
jgi:hypothetical protein